METRVPPIGVPAIQITCYLLFIMIMTFVINNLRINKFKFKFEKKLFSLVLGPLKYFTQLAKLYRSNHWVTLGSKKLVESAFLTGLDLTAAAFFKVSLAPPTNNFLIVFELDQFSILEMAAMPFPCDGIVVFSTIYPRLPPFPSVQFELWYFSLPLFQFIFSFLVNGLTLSLIFFNLLWFGHVNKP